MSAAPDSPARPAPARKDNTTLIVVIGVMGACLAQFLPGIAIFGLYAMLGGGFLGYMFLFDPAEVHVVAPDDRALAVSADGGEATAVEPGGHVVLDLRRGRHEIHIAEGSGGTTMFHEVDVKSGFLDVVAPATSDQCFVRIDVTDYAYPMPRVRSTSPPLPVLEDRIDERVPFDVGSSTWLAEEDMPSSLESGSSAHLLLGLDCDLLAGSDEEILAGLGF